MHSFQAFDSYLPKNIEFNYQTSSSMQNRIIESNMRENMNNTKCYLAFIKFK
jgi:hypothetical protein